MRAWRTSWTLRFALAAAVGLSCTNTEQGETPPPDESGEPSEPETPALDLWAGVPPLEAQADDITTKLTPRPEPLKPPSAHETIEVPLEAPEETHGEPPIPAVTGPLKVERSGPTGSQSLVDAVRLSFNQPMVPLADVAALKAATIPLTIEPAVPGTIDWLGTRTLAFVPEAGRMPFSTKYTVTVPAGVVSTWGEALAEDFSWTFSTPALELASSSPWNGSDGVALEPTITLTFNQTIERTALVGAMTLAGRGDRMALKLAPAPKVAAATTEPEWKAARRIQVVPERELRPNTHYTLSIPAGSYGEGPLESRPISLSFDTYPPLTVKRSKCWGTCWANQGIALETSTQISDPDAERKVHVSPEPANFAVNANWSSIQLSGDFEGRTRYTVTVDAGLRDIHGQTLAKSFTTNVKLGPPYPSVSMTTAVSDPVVLERAATKEIALVVSGVSSLELQARRLDIADVPSFLDAYPSDDRGWPTAHDAPTYTKRIGTPAAMKRTERMTLDLGPALAGAGSKGDGHLWFNLRSNPVKADGWTDRYGTNMLVEVTDLALAAALDRDSGLIMVTRLSNGDPVVGAKVSLHEGTGKTPSWTDVTDGAGLAHLTKAPASGSTSYLVVEHEGDSALLRVDRNDLRGRWRYYNASAPADTPRAFFYTDRTPYKPGDTVHLSGILRSETRGPKGSVELWRTDFSAEYRVTNPRGVEVAKGTTRIGKLGTFSVDIPTKEDHGTGDFQFVLTVGRLLGSDQTFYHSFPVETYRVPEFKVEVERPSSAPLVFGDELVAEIHGLYLHGAPLSGGEVSYVLRRSQTGFTPPGALNEGFTFGIDRGYGYGGYGYGYGYGGRRGYGEYGYGGWGPSYSSTVVAQGPGELDTRGVMTVKHALLAVEPPPEGTPAPAVPPKTKTKPEDEGPPLAATFTLKATVTDDNRQAIGGTGSFVVHAAKVYMGLRAEQTVLREGERAKLEAVVVDLEGERVLGRDMTLTLLRRETTRKAVERDGQWIYESETTNVETGSCPLTSALVPAKCELDVGKAGTYVVRGSSKDEDGNPTRSELQVYVHGKDAVVWESTERRVDLVPDRKEYQPGDTATLLVRSPFDRARGIVVVEREGIALEIPVVVEGGAATVEIPVTPEMIPSVSISAMLTRGRVEVPGAPKGQDLGMPAAAAGSVQLAVSTDDKKIAVALEPSARELAPGDTMKLTLTTTTVAGEALPAAVAVMVVDEGVLSLMGHQTPDPLSFFHHVRSDDVWLYALQASVLARDVPPPVSSATSTPTTGAFDREESTGEGTIGLGNTGLIGKGGGGSGYGRGSGASFADDAPAPPAAPGEPMPDAADGKKEYKRKSLAKPAPSRMAERRARGAVLDPSQAMAQPVSLREVFATTAYWQAEVLTDAEGKATLEIPMPENLTTFRVMAVAVDPAQADRFGKGDTTVRVRKPLMVRPSLPRFANFGDHFEASVMVDNQTGEDQAVLVGTRGLNVSLPGEAQKLLQIAAGESAEVRFDMETVEVGTMRLQFAALSNGGRDATEIELPVHYPATAEAFADYGMIDGATQRKVLPPPDALPAFGGLELSMSSTALSGLEDAVEYLVTYPYECAEQTASRVLPIFALSKILDEFPVASLRDRVYRNKLANDGIESLLAKQNYDGGFGYWSSRDNDSWPYLTNWVTLALLEGKAAGYAVDEAKLGKALDYVENFVAHGHVTRWGTYYDHTSRALGLWILSGEKRGSALFDRVWGHRKEVPLYARALLMAAAHRYGRTTARDSVLDELRDAAIESPRALHFAEGKSEAEADGLRVLMHSSVQTDAIALMALLEVVPTDPMLPKVMAGIMSSRDPMKGGRWGTTHANAWALLAADHYYRTVEADEPDYTARVWLDEQLSGEHRFKGRSMTSVEQRLPMAELQGKPERSVVLAKDGPGKLYFRMGLRYAPKDLVMPAEDQGFTVYREYTPLPEADGKPDPSAVQHLPDGSWQVKAGTNVKVTLTVVARDRTSYVVVDDALPAGFEGQNPRFLTSVAASGEASRSIGTDGWWWPWWSFSHTDLRDDRMLLFADQMPAGVYTYSYTARATNLGTFVLPPIKAEAMYEPERFGHSASSTVRVVE